MRVFFGLALGLQGPGRRERGQAMVEYAIILVLIAVVVIVILLTMGNQVHNVFSNVACALGARHCDIEGG